MVTFDLPQEILIEIFSWLPAKSVGKCRCLAKQWGTLLSTPQFIESHLIRRRDPETLIITTSSHSTHSIKDGAVSTKLEFPNKFEFVLGSCNGLVLLVDNEYNRFLVNPTTLRQVKIPHSPLHMDKEGFTSTYGFGYDKFSDDYKVVKLCFEPDCYDTFVDVYSVKRGIWNSVKRGIWKRDYKTSYDHVIPELHSGAFVNGAIHWLSRDFPYVIIAFNLVNDVFEEIPVPADSQDLVFNGLVVHSQDLEFNGLVVLGGCLCIFDQQFFGQMDFWVMKEYGVPESWTKFSINANYEWAFVKPLCFIGDENVVLQTEGHSLDGHLVVYNLKDRTLKDIFVRVVDGTTFIESLVSPRLL